MSIESCPITSEFFHFKLAGIVIPYRISPFFDFAAKRPKMVCWGIVFDCILSIFPPKAQIRTRMVKLKGQGVLKKCLPSIRKYAGLKSWQMIRKKWWMNTCLLRILLALHGRDIYRDLTLIRTWYFPELSRNILIYLIYHLVWQIMIWILSLWAGFVRKDLEIELRQLQFDWYQSSCKMAQIGLIW